MPRGAGDHIGRRVAGNRIDDLEQRERRVGKAPAGAAADEHEHRGDARAARQGPPVHRHGIGQACGGHQVHRPDAAQHQQRRQPRHGQADALMGIGRDECIQRPLGKAAAARGLLVHASSFSQRRGAADRARCVDCRRPARGLRIGSCRELEVWPARGTMSCPDALSWDDVAATASPPASSAAAGRAATPRKGRARPPVPGARSLHGSRSANSGGAPAPEPARQTGAWAGCTGRQPLRRCSPGAFRVSEPPSHNSGAKRALPSASSRCARAMSNRDCHWRSAASARSQSHKRACWAGRNVGRLAHGAPCRIRRLCPLGCVRGAVMR